MSKVLGSAPGDAQVQQLLLRRADEGLVAGDGTVRQILDALPAAVYVTDLAGQITYYNEAAATLWGHRPEIGKSQWRGSWKLYRADGTPLAHDQYPVATSLREMQAAPGAELIAERPDGSRIVFMPYSTLLYDASGALIGAVNMLVDLTDHKRAEANAQQLASIVEFSNDAIIGEDLDGVITSWNRGAERIYGYTAQEVIGKPVTILIPPEFRDEESGILERIRRGEVIDHYETIRQHKDGRRLDISLTVSPGKNTEGRIIGASKIACDITERHGAEQTAQRLASIVEFSDDAIVSKDLDGVITSWNQGAERLFGYTAEQAIGKPVTILIPADRPDEEPAILARLRRGERIDHYETTRQRKDGSIVEISLSVSPIRNSEGRVVGASKIARDITERRRAEERQHLLLREMDHRVKNLFALASGVVTLSARTATTPSELASDIRRRLSALARAHALTLSKSPETTGRTEQTVTLHSLIQTIVAPYEEGGEQSMARVVVSGTDVPLAAGTVPSFALLLHEFATNAAKYGALATPTGRIIIECSEENDQFILTWTEQGGPPVEHEGAGEGFGSLLARATIENQLDGAMSREWKRDGLIIRLSIARNRIGT